MKTSSPRIFRSVRFFVVFTEDRLIPRLAAISLSFMPDQKVNAIKLKAKDFANENAKKKTIRGLRFRRMKFFDMTCAFILAMLLTLGISNKSYAGSNDPVINLYRSIPVAAFNFLNSARYAGGDLNSLTDRFYDEASFLRQLLREVNKAKKDGQAEPKEDESSGLADESAVQEARDQMAKS